MGQDSFDITPGRVWLVPIDENGKLMAPAADITEAMSWNSAGGFDWGLGQGEDRGRDWGLDGGLEGGPDGALGGNGLGGRWEVQFEISGGISEETAALLMGFTIEEYRDLMQWMIEERWLKRLTGLNWRLE